jgi:hypothetical protein
MTGYSAMAMPAAVAAQTNSISAVRTAPKSVDVNGQIRSVGVVPKIRFGQPSHGGVGVRVLCGDVARCQCG